MGKEHMGCCCEAHTGNMGEEKLPPKRNIITLIGSTTFKDDFIKIAKEYTLKGYVVLHTDCFSHTDGDEYDDDEIKTLYQVSKDRIRLSDSVVVIDRDGYIGDSSLAEIQFARVLGKPVFYYYGSGNMSETMVHSAGITHGVDFVTISGGRQSGKTSMLIMLSNETKIPIVTMDYAVSKYIATRAKEMMEDIPEVFVYDGEDIIRNYPDEYGDTACFSKLLPGSTYYSDGVYIADQWKLREKGYILAGTVVSWV